jgi:cytochrome c1
MPDLPLSTLGLTVLTAVALATASVAALTANHLHDNQTRLATSRAMTGGNPGRAPPIFRRYGCSGCHTIPGIAGADGQTGGPLAGLSKRVYIAGVLENRSDNLVAWIVAPQRFSPLTAMPATGISEQEAKDLAAYLYAQ